LLVDTLASDQRNGQGNRVMNRMKIFIMAASICTLMAWVAWEYALDGWRSYKRKRQEVGGEPQQLPEEAAIGASDGDPSQTTPRSAA
jgi:hypothetical protein